MLVAKKDHLGVFLFKARSLGPITNDEFCSRCLKREKGLDIFFDSNPSDIEKVGAFPFERVPLPRMKEIGVNASRPKNGVLHAALPKLFDETGCRGHSPCARVMEPREESVADTQRNAGSDIHIFCKKSMKGGRKGKLSMEAIASGGKAQRPFRRDVDRIRMKGFKALDQFAFGA